MLLEKAWAKMKGNFEHINGGFIENGLQYLIGSPVFRYYTASENASTAFARIKQANALNYVLAAGTTGSGDTYMNSCGIAESHAYSIITTFELESGGTVDHYLYMVRNPWGISTYNGPWNQGDTANWTSNYISQVPFGVDPLTS